MKAKLYYTTLFLLCLLVPIEALSQNTENKLEIEIGSHFFSSQSIIGKLGSEVEYNPSDPDELDQIYGYDQESIYFDRDVNKALYVDISYEDFSLKVSRFNTKAETEGQVESSTSRLRWVRFWDANIIPVVNEEHSSGASPVDYYADDDFSRWGFTLSANDIFLHENEYRFSVYSGLQIDHIKYQFNLGQSLTAITSEAYEDFHFHNEISLDTESESKSLMIGPTIGAELDKDLLDVLNGTVKISADFQYSILHQWSNNSGVFTDIDDITLTSKDVPSFSEDVIFDGDVPFEERQKNWISSVNATVTTGFVLNSVEAGIGFTVYRISDIPLIPTFHNPWGLTGGEKAPTGIEWDIRERNLSFSGTTFYLRVKI